MTTDTALFLFIAACILAFVGVICLHRIADQLTCGDSDEPRY